MEELSAERSGLADFSLACRACARLADEYVDDAAPEEALKIRLDNVAADIDENIREIAKTLAPMKGERK
jgi:hypothetical protein